MNAEKVIIWAVDPFMRNKDKNLQRSAGEALRAFAGSGTSIEPVYVLNAPAIPGSLTVPLMEATRKAEFAAAQSVAELVAGLKLASVAPLKVLSDGYSGVRTEVTALLEYASSRHADLIVLSTHGRKGLGRWIMGSFAETTMLSSGIPLLVVNPRCKRKADFKNVLFPTDFSPESERAFEQVLKRMGNERGAVSIYHHISYLFAPEVTRAIKSNRVYGEMVESILAERRAVAERWAQQATKAGVQAKIIIDHKTTGSDAEAILKTVRRHPALIAMAGRSGKIVGSILGHTTRQVLRGASVPVWVVHDENDRERRFFEVTQEDVDVSLLEHRSGNVAGASR